MIKYQFFLLIALCIFCYFLPSFADEIIKGKYCYTYGDRETVVEAKEIAKILAIKDAIESYSVYIKAISKVENFNLTSDNVVTISTGCLRNIKILSSFEKDNTICISVQCKIIPEKIKKLLENEIKKIDKNSSSIKENKQKKCKPKYTIYQIQRAENFKKREGSYPLWYAPDSCSMEAFKKHTGIYPEGYIEEKLKQEKAAAELRLLQGKATKKDSLYLKTIGRIK